MKKYKIWERTAFRVIIFFLCGIFAVGSVCLALIGEKKVSDYWSKNDGIIAFDISDIFSTKDFLETETFRQTAENKVYEILYLHSEFSGKGWQDPYSGEKFENAVKKRTRDIYEELRNEILYNKPAGTEHTTTIIEDTQTEDYRYYVYLDIPVSTDRPDFEGQIVFDMLKIIENPVLMHGGAMRFFEDPGVREEFEKTFPEQIVLIREDVMHERGFRFHLGMMGLRGLMYFVSDGERVLSNVVLISGEYPNDPEGMMSQPAWIFIEDNTFSSNPKGLYTAEKFLKAERAIVSAIIAWPENILTEYRDIYYGARSIYISYFFTAAALMIGALVLLVMSIAFTGRKRPAYNGTRKLWKGDGIFVEIQIIILLFLFSLGSALVSAFLASSSRYYMNANYEMYIIFASCIGLVFVFIFLWFLLSLVRIGKAGLTADRSLICRFANGPGKALNDMIKSGFDGRNPLAKTIILVIILWLLTALFAGICGVALGWGLGGAVLIFGILILLTLAGALYFSSKWVARYERLRKGVEEIGNGNLGYKIEIKGDGKNEFDRLSALVNELGSAQSAAMLNEIKNQRLKTDLISNVSHDLKTPLTSIITYTDLLKKEGLKSKNAEEYLRIIDEKGRRLQKLTEDLFDAAKASSGAIPVRKTKVDLLALIKQEIAEMNGSFDEAGLELVIEAPNEHYYAEADSQLLWRVVDNLLRNAQKYAQPGTRIYIELSENGNTTLAIKNTSAVKLNISPDELMERFKRGDESRASDGSGLGLAIAKDLTSLQDGRFDLFIDGDLFKTIVTLPPWKEKKENDS